MQTQYGIVTQMLHTTKNIAFSTLIAILLQKEMAIKSLLKESHAFFAIRQEKANRQQVLLQNNHKRIIKIPRTRQNQRLIVKK